MNIKKARKKKKLKQKELAEMIGYTESSISKYEQGLIQIPNTVIELLAKALDVSPIDLLGVDEWEEQFNPDGKLSKESNLYDSIQEVFGKEATELLEQFSKLNEIGRQKAVSDLADMTEVSKYKK